MKRRVCSRRGVPARASVVPLVALALIGCDARPAVVAVDSGAQVADYGVHAADRVPDVPPPRPPRATRARFPVNGFTTGSPHVQLTARVVDHPLMPKLMWEAVAGASSYQLQMTSECEVATFRSCAFVRPVVDVKHTGTTYRPAAPLPINTAIPVGRRYYWRVRACNAGGCSAYTEVRYLDVGRHAKDFNGDGYADVVVGARRQDNPELDEGAVYVYFGSPSGTRAVPDVTIDNPLDQADGRFGSVVASAGDVNGDGYADLVVGATLQDNPEIDEGSAYLFLGSAKGPRTIPDLVLDNPLDQPGGNFGNRLAGAGDVNGDGYADLVVAARRQDNPEEDEGVVYLFWGSAKGLGATPDVTLDSPLDQPLATFGSSLAGAGDVNGDGYADFVVGASWTDNPLENNGAAYVFFGSGRGPKNMPDVTLESTLDQANSNFGWSVASAGDVNGDGYSDLVIGASLQDNPAPDEGAAYLFWGSATGPKPTPDATFDNPAHMADGRFGIWVAGGDVNGDGYSDLVIGAFGQDIAPGRVEDVGAVFVYFGAANGIGIAPDVTLENPLRQHDGWFGRPVANAGDVNGDGYADLVVGAYRQDNPEENEGAAYVFFGSAAGPRPTPDVTLDNPLDQSEGSFGAAVACVDDIGGQAQLAVASSDLEWTFSACST